MRSKVSCLRKRHDATLRLTNTGIGLFIIKKRQIFRISLMSHRFNHSQYRQSKIWKLNPIELLSLIEFGDRTKSNTEICDYRDPHGSMAAYFEMLL